MESAENEQSLSALVTNLILLSLLSAGQRNSGTKSLKTLLQLASLSLVGPLFCYC